MRSTSRTVGIIAGALTAVVVTGTAAMSAPSTGSMSQMRGGEGPAHMADIDADTLAQMTDFMDSGATVGEMHQWMGEQDMPIGQMHRAMATSGMNPGQMHRTMTPPTR